MTTAEDRILDVNINRAGEALRTMEEYARFVLNSPALCSRCKAVRHDLAGLAARLAQTGAAPIAARDITGDAGADVKTDAENTRADAGAVAAAAARRAQQALRVLGEFAKIRDAAAAAGFEELRYKTYAIEPLLLAGPQRRARLASARLYVLITTSLCSTDPVTAAREAVAGGADIIQLREKEMEDKEFYALACSVAEVCRTTGSGALFLVNDRPHIAALCGADGIHSGQGDLPVHLARRIIGFDRIIGRSTSAPEFAQTALADGADYIGTGPVYETNTKQHRAAVGTQYVAWAAQWGQLPFFAIGSVNRSTIDAVLEAGARGVAICTAITKAKDIAAEAAFFKARLLGKA